MAAPGVPAAARVGGYSLILAAVLFLATFSYLAATFDYPDVLDRSAGEVLPRLLALGTNGRAVWLLYASIPLLLVPAGIGAAATLKRAAPGAARNASVFATIAAIAMMLGLLRWPSIQWHFAREWASAGEAQRASIASVFAGLNAYLGTFLGEFVGELCLNLFFALTAYAMLKSPDRPRWNGIAGLVVSVIGFLAMFRSVTPAVGMIAEANNYVLPIWLIVLGVALVKSPRE